MPNLRQGFPVGPSFRWSQEVPKGSEERTIVIKQALPEFPGLINLNLPAAIEEEANGYAEIMP